jgi:hypothetical protein
MYKMNLSRLNGKIITPLAMEVLQQTKEVISIVFGGLSTIYSNHWKYIVNFINGKNIEVYLPYKLEVSA